MSLEVINTTDGDLAPRCVKFAAADEILLSKTDGRTSPGGLAAALENRSPNRFICHRDALTCPEDRVGRYS